MVYHIQQAVGFVYFIYMYCREPVRETPDISCDVSCQPFRACHAGRRRGPRYETGEGRAEPRFNASVPRFKARYPGTRVWHPGIPRTATNIGMVHRQATGMTQMTDTSHDPVPRRGNGRDRAMVPREPRDRLESRQGTPGRDRHELIETHGLRSHPFRSNSGR